jgi:hypothetical protein
MDFTDQVNYWRKIEDIENIKLTKRQDYESSRTPLKVSSIQAY